MKQLFTYEQVAERIANIRMIKTVKQLFIYEQVAKRIVNIGLTRKGKQLWKYNISNNTATG